MIETIVQSVAGMAGEMNRSAVRKPLRAIGDRMSAQLLNSGGLRISGGSASPLVQAATAFYAAALGALVTKAANTNMAALFSNVANGTFNVYVFTINKAGILTTQIGLASTTLAGVVFPQLAEGAAVIGFVIINPTGTGPFVGGTTNLDDATVVPNAVFINTPSPFDPTILPA